MKNSSFLPHHDGSSFFDFLSKHYPSLTPCLNEFGGQPMAMAQDLSRSGMLSVPHGTTVLAIKYRDGAIIAGDRRATEGFQIADRRIEKVFRIDDYSAMAIAGAAGPCIEMAKLFQTELEHYEKLEGVQLSCEGKANKLGQMVKANLPMVFQGLVVMPLYVGYDLKRNEGRIFKYDITGGATKSLNTIQSARAAKMPETQCGSITVRGCLKRRRFVSGSWRSTMQRMRMWEPEALIWFAAFIQRRKLSATPVLSMCRRNGSVPYTRP